MEDHKQLNRKIEWIIFISLAVIVVFFIQLVILQVFKYSFFKRQAQKQQLETVTQQIGRGTIYTSDGKKMALSIKAYSLCANPRLVRNKAGVAEMLSKELGINKQEVLTKLNGKKEFVFISRKVDADKAQRIIDRNIEGIFPHVEEKRYYPMKESGAHLVGFSGTDNTGLEGIESAYEKYLRGKIGSVQVKRDAKGRPVMIDSVDIRKAEAGADLRLTIDSNIQCRAQQELSTAVEKYKGKSGMLISMDPNTGAIYALANYPTFDPNDFAKSPGEARRDRVVTDIFEPGSTFKIFSMSAVLKDRPQAYEEKVFCSNGSQLFFDRYVHDHEKHGWLTVPEVIKYSSNIGMVNLALNVKAEALYKEYSSFGFGRVTGIDIPGEVPGMLRNFKDWDNATLSSIPYGQEVAVTAIQLACAYSALANGGYMVRPYVVDKIEKDNSVIYTHKAGERVKVLDDRTRRMLVNMLEMVTEKDGTGKKASITGYRVAGKTGTSQKHNPKGKGYLADKYVCSFIGFLPADKPEILTLVVVDEPSAIWAFGGDVAAPAFKNLSNQMISYLHVIPGQETAPQAAPPQPKTASAQVPDFYLKQYSEAKKFLSDKEIKVERIGFGRYVVGQKPEPRATVSSNSTVSVYLGDLDKNKQVRIYMPDLRGYTIRKAMDVLSVYGIRAKCNGSGVAVTQEPKPGVAIKKGGECVVNFDLKDNT